MTDAFFDVPRTTHQTSAGPVELPILYLEARNVMALFEASLDGVRALLAPAGLEPGVVYAGRALVGMSFYEYTRTSIGPYNEVGTALFAVRHGERGGLRGVAELLLEPRTRRVGAWVADLPVTTEAACAAGCELWGFPKFVTRIDFALTGRRLSSAVFDPSGVDSICTLAGTAGPSTRIPGPSLLTLSRHEGALLRTPVDVRAPTRLHLPGDVRLRLGQSRHRMAEHLRALGLDGAAPRALVITERFQSLLHPGSPG
jgi:hypothetical protein